MLDIDDEIQAIEKRYEGASEREKEIIAKELTIQHLKRIFLNTHLKLFALYEKLTNTPTSASPNTTVQYDSLLFSSLPTSHATSSSSSLPFTSLHHLNGRKEEIKWSELEKKSLFERRVRTMGREGKC